MFFISSVMISKGTNIKVFMCLVLNFIVLVKSDLFKEVGPQEEEPGSKLPRYAAYIPTLATTFPAHFPVFFIDDGSEIPRNRFGFNVIYGMPKNFDGVYPISIDLKNSLNRNPSEHLVPLHSEIKGSFLSKKNYANTFPFVPVESVANPHEPKSSLVTLNDDDWSSEEEETSHNSKQYKPPSTTNIYRKFYKPIKSSPVSYVNDYRSYPQKPVEGNLKKSRNPRIYSSQNNKSSSTQRFHKPGLKSSRPAEKLYHREAFKTHPQRKIFSKTSTEPFRPSPPDVFLNSRQSQTDFSTDYSNSVPKYSKFGNVTEDIKVHTCVRTNKTDPQDKYPKKIRYCYACVDNKSGTRFEQCTYEETPLKYHPLNYQKRTAPTLFSNMHFRAKRELISTISKEEQTRNERQNDYYEPNKDHSYETYNQNYRFGPEHFVDDERAAENEEISYETDDPDEKCWKRRKGEMLCIACENTNTGGTYEQCSYASDPNNTSYEQSVSREYGSSRFAEDDGRPYTDAILVQPTTVAPTPLPQPHQEASLPLDHAGRHPNTHHVPYNNGYIPNTPLPTPKYVPSFRTPPLPVPPFYTVPANTYFHDVPGFNDNFGRYRFSGPNNYRNPYSGFDDSFSNIFPEMYSNPEPLSEFDDESEDGEFAVSLDDEEGQFTINNKYKIPRNTYPGYSDKMSRKEGLKRALFEMSHKNKTECKKLIKHKMTCYLCIDEKGSKREDCIYFKPKPIKNNKMMYHNYSEFNSTPKSDHIVTKSIINRPEARLVTPRGRYIPPHIINKSKSRFPYHSVIRPKQFNEGIEGNRYARSSDNKENVANPNIGISLNSSTEEPDHIDKENESTIKNESVDEIDNASEKETKKDLKIVKNKEKYNSVPPEPEELKEFKTNTEGKFSKDTELMFDPILGISLPKYMLKKSEHEAIFDEILASG